MPADEYSSARGGGALKLKGAKVDKKKKKKTKPAVLDAEKAVATLDALSKEDVDEEDEEAKLKTRRNEEEAGDGNDENDDESSLRRNGEERKEKEKEKEKGTGGDGDEGDEDIMVYKTATERRFEEARRKKLEKLARESGSARPDLLKTHKERVEELNTYLSRLSEHHDMPKIGPG